MYVESFHALALARIFVQLNGHRRRQQALLTVKRLSDSAIRKLRAPTSSNVGEQCDQIKQAMHLAAGLTWGPKSNAY